MELEHSFTIPVPAERAWHVLLDVEQVAPCMPGATVDSVEGDVITGRIKVKVGPVALTYSGSARFTERDEQALSVTLEASGRETRGSGTASATVRSSLRDEGGQTRVVVHTTMRVTGRPAQIGRGVMAEVGGRIIEKFATNLAAQLAGGQEAALAAGNGARPQVAAQRPAGAAEAAGPAAASGAAAPSGPAAPDETTLALPVEELKLPARAFNSLRREGIHTVGDLCARTESQLLAITNLGPQSVKDIEHKLAERGLGLTAATEAGAAAPGAGAQAVESGPAGTGTGAAAGAGVGAGGAPATGPRAGSPATAGRGTTPAGGGGVTPMPPRAARPPDGGAIDLLSGAGFPGLKRVPPVAGVIVAALLILLRVRRHHRRRATSGS